MNHVKPKNIQWLFSGSLIAIFLVLPVAQSGANDRPARFDSVQDRLPSTLDASWLDALGEPTALGRSLRLGLGHLDRHGIDPDPFLARFDAASRDPSNGNAAITELLAQTVLLLRYGQAPVPKQDRLLQAQGTLAAMMTPGGDGRIDFAAAFVRIAARNPNYIPLQNALALYRVMERSGVPEIDSRRKIVPGAVDPRIADVRRFLGLTGEYDNTSNVPVKNTRYDPELVAAVKSFQRHHGLEEDGIISKATLSAINVPIAERIEELRLSLERLREMPDLPVDYIHVNLPSYQLTAYHDHVIALHMRVIVGETALPTPEFVNSINALVVNPSWTPTDHIVKSELLPKLRNNPHFRATSGFQFIDRRTGESLPADTDWNAVSAGDIVLRQPSGDGNALGKVKFLMPASDSIYLHDTAKPGLFKQSARALSHGCIRLEKPKALMDYVFSRQASWDKAKTEKAYAAKDQRSFALQKPIPVYATYFTAWIDDDGMPEFYGDVYRKNKSFETAFAGRIEKTLAAQGEAKKIVLSSR